MQANRSNRNKLRVLTLVDGIGLAGGGERLARQIVAGLDPERFERTLCVSRWSPEQERRGATPQLLAELERAGVRFVGLRRRSAADLAAWRPLLRLLRRERIDVLHAHKFGSNVWAAILGSLARTPVVIAHEHTWSFEGKRLRKLLDRRLIAPRVDAFLTVSREDRRRMAEIEGVDPAKLIFVPNGIPAPAPPSGADIRAELGIPAGAPVVGTVCALRPQKALEVLIEAARPLLAEVPDLRVLIVGDGAERGALERRIDALGLGGVVMLLGHRDDVPDVLQGLDVAVLCSDFEGTPLSVLEYMEAALPVVATRVGGVPDLVEEGKQGLLVERRDPGGLAEAVATLLRDPSTARAMGERGRARRREQFDLGVTVAEVERIYAGLAGGATAAELAAAS